MACADVQTELDEATQLYASGKYEVAISKLKVLAERFPREVTAHYYIALCADALRDKEGAQEAMSRVIAMSAPGSLQYKQALQFFKNFSGGRSVGLPYSAVNQGQLVRWSPQLMPIKIYVSRGLQLPPAYAGLNLTAERFRQLQPLLKNPAFYASLKPSPGYREDYLEEVQRGLNQWQSASREGILRYTVVDDPVKANVLVFWSSSLGPFAAKTQFSAEAGKCIMQIATKFDATAVGAPIRRPSFQVTAAHEFGHAWGLPHSDNSQSIMQPAHDTIYANKGAAAQSTAAGVSASDIATLRALYSLPADTYLR